MFRRAAAYHPYKHSTPLSSAGFRLGDFIPKRRCFNLFGTPADFTTTRSPDPSPLSSPVRGAPNLEPDSDGPPSVPLADALAAEDFTSAQRPSTPFPDRRRNPPRNAAGPSKESFPVPPRRKKCDTRCLSSKKDAPLRAHGVFPRRRSKLLQAKRKAFRKKLHDNRERRMTAARSALTGLCKEAEALMSPEHMNEEDWIFMEQLQKLELDQMYAHDLERGRGRMANAAEEAEERREAHEARDAEAERLWAKQPEEEAREEQKKMVEEFAQRKDESWEARAQRAEKEAIRADEKRQRAHLAAERAARDKQERLFREELARKAEEELRRQLEYEKGQLREEKERLEREENERRKQEQVRKLQEEVERIRKARKEQERKLREETERREAHERHLREEQECIRKAQRERLERQEQERKLREDVERQRREANEMFLREQRERLAREEQERQARMRAEEARRAAEEEQLRQYFATYEAKWTELRTSNCLPPIDVREMPWPVIGVVSSVDQISYEGVRMFLFHPLRPGVEGKTARDKVKSEVLRFHPDKFNTRIVPKVQMAQQAVAYEIAGAVARILTTIMTEVA